MSPRVLLPLMLTVPVGLVAAACSPSALPYQSGATGSETPTESPARIVNLKFDSFEPSLVTVHVGQTVEWTFQQEQIPGNVTFAHFASPTKQRGTWSYTFTSPGNYPYRDTLRAEAVGEVVVVP